MWRGPTLVFPNFFKLLFFLTMNSCCVVIFLLILVGSFSLFVLIQGKMRVSTRTVNRELRINLAIWLLAPSSFSALPENNEHYLASCSPSLGRWGSLQSYFKVKGLICSWNSVSLATLLFKEQKLLLGIIAWIISSFSISELPIPLIVSAIKILGLVVCHIAPAFWGFLDQKESLFYLGNMMILISGQD